MKTPGHFLKNLVSNLFIYLKLRGIKIFVLLFFFLFAHDFSFSQSISYKQRLYYTCKVWGFVKYYHSNVSVCKVNWDSVLVSVIPRIKSDTSVDEFNNTLKTMLIAAGPMTIASSPLPDTIPNALKRNRNFDWINSKIFRADIVGKLDTIKVNFRPHPICWVQNNTHMTNYYGYLVFPYDSLMLNANTYTNYPDEAHRLLVLFKHWNIINYFDPYTYVFDLSMDSILSDVVIPIASAQNDNSFFVAIRKMTAQFDDAHVEGGTNSNYLIFPFRGYNFPKLVLMYIENKYVVVKSGVSGIYRGDVLVSIDGKTTSQWEDSLKGYVSAGNPSVFHRFMYLYLLGGQYNSNAAINVLDSNGNSVTIKSRRIDYLSDGWFPSYYPPIDSLGSVSWTTIGCDVGYVNMGNLMPSDLSNMYSDLMNRLAIIFDLRNYPNTSIYDIVNMIYPNYKSFVKFSVPDVTYPGTFFWIDEGGGFDNNQNAYNGAVYILMNEQTQSAAEYDCMALGAMPHAIKIGSQTAGTDGDITYFRLSQDIYSTFTSLGTYYPNGDSTERIGIVPDIKVLPTIKAIRHGEDEVLDMALKMACQSGIKPTQKETFQVDIYPNPAKQFINITTKGNMTNQTLGIKITDITGKTLISQSFYNYTYNGYESLNISCLHAGMYFIKITSKDQTETIKFLKQ